MSLKYRFLSSKSNLLLGSIFFLALIISVLPSQAESATTYSPIFSDDFTRADSATVGNGWVDGSTPRYSISNNTLVGGGTGARFLQRPLSEAVQSTRVQVTFTSSSTLSSTFMIGTNYNGNYGYVVQVTSSQLLLLTYASTSASSNLTTTPFVPKASSSYVLTLDVVGDGTNSSLTATIASSTASTTPIKTLSTTNSSALYQNIGKAFLINAGMAGSISRFDTYQIVQELVATTTLSTRTPGTFTLGTAVSGGLTPYTYRWDVGETPTFATSSGTVLSGEVSSTLTSTPPSIGNAKYYKMTVTSSDGQSTTTPALGIGADDPYVHDRSLVIQNAHIAFNSSMSSVGSTTETYQQAYPVTQALSDIRVNYANTFSIYGGLIRQGEYSSQYSNELTLEASALVLNSSGALVSGPTRLTFNGGENSVTVPYTAGISTDPLSISAAAGQTILIRTYVQAPSGGRIPLLDQAITDNANTNLKTGATHTGVNDIMSIAASFNPGSGLYTFSPASIHGTISGSPTVTGFDTHGVTLIGDSIMEGATSYGNIIAALTNLPYLNIGRAGETANTFSGIGGQVRRSVMAGQPILFDQYGVNDIRQSRTYDQLKTSHLSIWTEFARTGGRRLITATLTPLSNENSGQNNYTSTSTQTISSNSAARASWNTYLRDGSAAAAARALGLQYYNIDVASAVEHDSNNNTSIWLNNAGTVYTTDGVHPNTAGITAIVNAASSTLRSYMTAPWESFSATTAEPIRQNSTNNTITLTGTDTSWTTGTPGSPTFSLSSESGASIVSQVVTSSTTVSLTVNAGTSTEVLIITDPISLATTSISVVAQVVSSGGFSTTQTMNADGSITTTSGDITTTTRPTFYSSMILPVSSSTIQLVSASSTVATASTTKLEVEATQTIIQCSQDHLFDIFTGRRCSKIAEVEPYQISQIQQTAQNNAQYSDSFTSDLKFNMRNPEVRMLQIFLNAYGFRIAPTGVGSPGRETDYFGSLTRSALVKFQKANSITPAIGYFGSVTRAKIKQLGY